MKNIHLIRDYLDDQIIDVNGCKMGRVDGITIRLRKGQPPRVVSLDVGSPILFERVSRHLARFIDAIGKGLGVKSGPLHIDPKHILHSGIDLKVDLDAEKCGAYAWEDWWREHVVRHIPGSGL